MRPKSGKGSFKAKCEYKIFGPNHFCISPTTHLYSPPDLLDSATNYNLQLFSQGEKQVVWNCGWFSRTPSSRHIRRPRQDFILLFNAPLFGDANSYCHLGADCCSAAHASRTSLLFPGTRTRATAASHTSRCRRAEASMPLSVGGLERRLILFPLSVWLLFFLSRLCRVYRPSW